MFFSCGVHGLMGAQFGGTSAYPYICTCMDGTYTCGSVFRLLEMDNKIMTLMVFDYLSTCCRTTKGGVYKTLTM
jgi:hypothetical protein